MGVVVIADPLGVLFWGTIIFAILTVGGVLALGFIHPAPPSRSARPIVEEYYDYVMRAALNRPSEQPTAVGSRHPLAPIPAPIPDAYLGSPIEEIAKTATYEL